MPRPGSAGVVGLYLRWSSSQEQVAVVMFYRQGKEGTEGERDLPGMVSVCHQEPRAHGSRAHLERPGALRSSHMKVSLEGAAPAGTATNVRPPGLCCGLSPKGLLHGHQVRPQFKIRRAMTRTYFFQKV